MPNLLRPVLLLAIPLALVAIGLTQAQAGIDPSPFQPEINQLRAVENILVAHESHLKMVLSLPPNDILPDPSLANQLDAIAMHLARQEVRIYTVVSPVLGMPPDDQLPADLVPVMSDLEVRSAAIATRAQAGFAIPPNDQRVLDALEIVASNAQSLMTTVSATLGIRLYTMVNPCNLLSIEPGSGVTVVGSIGAGAEAFSFSPGGVLYATAAIDACHTHPAADHLITVDLDSGLGTDVGEIEPGDWDALAFAPDGRLYTIHAGSGELAELDPATGAIRTIIGTVLEANTGTGFGFLGALDFSPEGVLYAVDKFDGSGGPSTLLTIDLATGAATVVGELGVNSVTGIAFTDSGALYGISDPTLLGPDGESGGTGDLIVIDPLTGASVAVLHVTDVSVDGLAVAPGPGGE